MSKMLILWLRIIQTEQHILFGEIIQKVSHSNTNSNSLDRSLARHYDTLGLVKLFNQSSPDVALDYFQQALELRNESSNMRLLSISLMNIGIAYAELGKTQQATQQFYKSLTLRETYQDPYDMAVIHLNLAEMHLRNEETDRIKHHAILAKKLIDENDIEALKSVCAKYAPLV